MRRAVVGMLILIGAVLVSTAALAQVTVGPDTTVSLGSGLVEQIRDVVLAIAGAVIAAAGGWLSYWVKQKFGIDIEAKHREALTAFLTRQASALLSMGAVKLEGVRIDVKSDAVASLARTAFTAIPDAMKFFNLTPQIIGDMIVDLIPKQPAVASAQAIALDTKNPQTPDVEAKGSTKL